MRLGDLDLMNYTSGLRSSGRNDLARALNPASVGSSSSRLGWCALGLMAAMSASVPASAQQKTGPGITGDDSLTWHGITLYGVIDLGVQFDTHSAPFTPYRPAASGNIVRENSNGRGVGVTAHNMAQSRV